MMGNLSKTALLLLFFCLLSFAGISGCGCEQNALVASVTAADAETDSSISQGEQLRFELFQEAGVTLVSPVNSQAPGLKNQAGGYLNLYASLEHRLQGLVLRYISNAKGISLGLASNEIIFPFHTFW